MHITLAHRARRSDDVLFQVVGGEAVLLDLRREQYFGLNPVGTRIWQLLADDAPLQSVFETICNEYAVAPESARQDLIELIEQLAAADLVQVA